MHESAAYFCEDIAKLIGINYGEGLDIGGRNVNGTVRSLWPLINWVIIDLNPENTNESNIVEWDYTKSNYELERFDIILCTEVLEHCKNWYRILANAWLDLKENGTLILTCAGYGREPHSAVDGGPLRENEWYGNIDLSNIYHALHSIGFKHGEIRYSYTDHDIYVAVSKM